MLLFALMIQFIAIFFSFSLIGFSLSILGYTIGVFSVFAQDFLGGKHGPF